MAHRVHKNISSAELSAFLNEMQRQNEEAVPLKTVNNSEYIRARRTALSYWRKQGALQFQGALDAVREIDHPFDAHHNRYEMIEMMEAEPPELSEEKELPPQVFRRLKGLTAFVSTWESELTATKRRAIQEGIYADRQQMNPLTTQSDSINKLCEKELLAEFKKWATSLRT